MCFSTAPSDSTSAPAMPELLRPSAIIASTSRSRGLSRARGESAHSARARTRTSTT